MGKIEDLKAKKAQIDKKISQLQTQYSNDERKADTHLKSALGGAVLTICRNKTLSLNFENILKIADGGVQKVGLGREKFEALKETLKNQDFVF